MILCIPKQTTVTHGPQLLASRARLPRQVIRMTIDTTLNLRSIICFLGKPEYYATLGGEALLFQIVHMESFFTTTGSYMLYGLLVILAAME